MDNVAYNDGRWHGWNGGECPVHPLSKVKAVVSYDAGQEERKLASVHKAAGEFHTAWDWMRPTDQTPHPSYIIAFRVTKPYHETNLEAKTERLWLAKRPGTHRRHVFLREEDAREYAKVDGQVTEFVRVPE